MGSVIILALCICIVFIILIIFYKKNKQVSEGFRTVENSGIRTFANLTNNSDNPWTIDKPTRLIITDIIRKIINNINDQTSMSYYFVDYDQLKQEVISPVETRFTADIFVHGSEAALRATGKLRTEGREYIVKDGDTLNVRFNV
jgi:hypothetical protein